MRTCTCALYASQAQEFLRERDAPLARLDAAGSVNRQFSTLAQGWATLFLLVLRQGWPVLSLRNLVGPKPNMREAWRRQAAQDPEHFRDWAWPDHRLSLRPCECADMRSGRCCRWCWSTLCVVNARERKLAAYVRAIMAIHLSNKGPPSAFVS